MFTDSPAFALLHRQRRPGSTPDIEVLYGHVTDVERLADIPLTSPVLALVPFRQVAELGYPAHDDGTPLTCLIVEGRETLTMEAALAALPERDFACTAGGFDIDDESYAALVKRVIADEIGRGEGANFVLRRDFSAQVSGDPLEAALTIFRRLLSERGAYWTFLVHTPDRTLVGATPERHVSVEGGSVRMNPISGTYRYPPQGPTSDGLLRFLDDVKEVEELYMVVDEELKMMSDVCADGGRVLGPRLKEMGHLAHTEYTLEGISTLDVREILRRTMFAATVTGSPVPNACRVIREYEPTGRGYYSGALAYFEDEHTLDSPILIRTLYLAPDGTVTLPVGTTLVRHSVPADEVAETHAKAAAALAALTGDVRPAALGGRLSTDPRVEAALVRRNEHLSDFWIRPQAPGEHIAPDLAGRSALVVAAGDGWASMLAHLLRSLGLAVTTRSWDDAPDTGAFDLVVPGPGPGDPRDLAAPKIAALDALVRERLAQRRPLFAVCLGHQVLCGALGLPLVARATPLQGTQREVDLFGQLERVGFYNTFTALTGPVPADVELARGAGTTEVLAVRGPRFAGTQFHPESILTTRGLAIARRLISGVL